MNYCNNCMRQIEEEAKEAPEKNGLTFKIKNEYSDEVKEGEVVEQSVKAEKVVEEGTEIIVTISKGEKPEDQDDENDDDSSVSDSGSSSGGTGSGGGQSSSSGSVQSSDGQSENGGGEESFQIATDEYELPYIPA